MTETKHTPTPWIQVVLHPTTILGAGQLSKHAFKIVPDNPLPGGYGAVEAQQMCEANAALAVRSVNALPEILEALRALCAKIDPACLVERDTAHSALSAEYRSALNVLEKYDRANNERS